MTVLDYCLDFVDWLAVTGKFVAVVVRREHNTYMILVPERLPASIGGWWMRTSVLIPLIFFVSAGSVQAAERPAPTEPPVSHFQGACDSDPDGKRFAEKACYTTYNPGKAGFGAAYHPPGCDKSAALTDRQKESLAKAYARAPAYVKAKLCRLTQLFVTHSYDGAWVSWGFWEGADRPPGKGVYLAISEQDLGREQSFVDAENETVNALLRRTDGRRSSGRLPSLRTSAPAEPGLTVLGVLTHELGHALLADTNADGTDPRHPRRRVSGPPTSKCFEDAFLGASWDANRFHRHMRRWVAFGDQYHNRQKNPDAGHSLDILRNAARRGRLDLANDAITNVYRSKEFVSFFASVSPEEDFVETYKYKVLADAARNQPVAFRLSGHDVNVLDFLDSGIPSKKVECLRDLGLLTGQP